MEDEMSKTKKISNKSEKNNFTNTNLRVDGKEYKPIPKDARGVLLLKKEKAMEDVRKYSVLLNNVRFDLENNISLDQLEYNKNNYEKSIAIEEKNIAKIDQLLDKGYEIGVDIKAEQGSDQVSKEFDNKERIKKTETINPMKELNDSIKLLIERIDSLKSFPKEEGK